MRLVGLCIVVCFSVYSVGAAPSGKCDPLSEEAHCYNTLAERDTPSTIVDGVVTGTLKGKTGEKSGGSILARLMLLFGFDPDTDSAFTYIVAIVNYALGIGASIAIVFIIYGFAKIIISDNHDEAFGNARKIVRGAAIALAVMILAMILARFMLQFYGATTAV